MIKSALRADAPVYCSIVNRLLMSALRADAPVYNAIDIEASAELSVVEITDEMEQFVLEQMIADAVVELGEEEQNEANDILDSMAPSVLPCRGIFDSSAAASDEEIQEAGELYILEQEIFEVAEEAADEEYHEALVGLKQLDLEEEMQLFVAEIALADAVIEIAIDEQKEVNDALELMASEGAKTSRFSATESEIQSAGEIFQLQNEIAELEQAVIEEITDEVYRGT